MVLDFNVEVKHFADNVPLATTAAAIETWLDSLNISAVGAGLVPSGLVLDLPMNEGTGTTLTDRSGNGNNGNLNGCTWVAGKKGRAISLNGSSDYVAISDSTSLDITTAITIVSWVKLVALTNYMRIVDKYRSTAYMLAMEENGLLQFEAKIGGVVQSFVFNTALTINTWAHVAVTYINTGTVNLYLNGVVDRTLTAATIGNIGVNAYPLWLGKDPAPGGDYWNGIIDEIRIYNRALSALEIKKLYYDRFQDRIHKIKIQRKYGFYEVKVIYV